MADLVPVTFMLKTSSAGSLCELMEKAKDVDYAALSHNAISVYRQLMERFNKGCDLVEVDEANETGHLIDLFGEAASKTSRYEVKLKIGKVLAQQLCDDFGRNNLSFTFMNAIYFYDRVYDTQARGRAVGALDPENGITTIYKMPD